jgi:hypothetical protein
MYIRHVNGDGRNEGYRRARRGNDGDGDGGQSKKEEVIGI